MQSIQLPILSVHKITQGTVGIRIPIMSGIQMSKAGVIVEWFGFEMLAKMKDFFLGFRCFQEGYSLD